MVEQCRYEKKRSKVKQQVPSAEPLGRCFNLGDHFPASGRTLQMDTHTKEILPVEIYFSVVLQLAPAIFALHGIDDFRNAIAYWLDAQVYF